MKWKGMSVIWLTWCSAIFGQSTIPQLLKEGDRSFYGGMYNEFKVDLNGVSAEEILLKCHDASISKLTDSSFQVFVRNPLDEVKVKLYYKNLPVDVYILPVKLKPKVRVRLADNATAISKGALATTSMLFELDDQVIINDGFQFYNCKAIITDPQGRNQMSVVYETNFGRLVNLLRAIPNADKILITDINFKNKQNQVLACDANAFEVLLKP